MVATTNIHIYHTPGQTVTGAQARTGVAVSLSRTLLVLPASPSPDHIELETSNKLKLAANLDPDSLADSEVVHTVTRAVTTRSLPCPRRLKDWWTNSGHNDLPHGTLGVA